MRPMSLHREHFAWQQRVTKERGVVKDFVRTFGSVRLPDTHLQDFKDFFPLRRPLTLSSVPADWAVKKPWTSFGGTILGKRLKEVRGKYSRPVEEVNGLVRLLTTDGEQRSRAAQRPDNAAKGGKAQSVGSSRRPTPPLAYISQLRSELQSERAKRVSVEGRLSAMLG